jgi:cell division protein FtsQ
LAKFGSVKRKDAKAHRQARAAAQSADGFWDRPQLLTLVADLLLLFGGATLAYAMVLAAIRLPFFPLRQVLVTNAPSQVTRAQIEAAAKSSLSGNFFTVNLDAVRAAFEKQAWVRHASVRRHWPDGIELTIEEHAVAARWQHGADDTRLVNGHGEVFVAPVTASQATLPLLAGPEGSAPLVLARYHQFASLLEPLHRTLRVVALSPRQAWQLRLDDGLTLELGRDQPKHPIEERIARFVGTYGEAKARSQTAISTIDMRYPNGFALRPGHNDKGNA